MNGHVAGWLVKNFMLSQEFHIIWIWTNDPAIIAQFGLLAPSLDVSQ